MALNESRPGFFKRYRLRWWLSMGSVCILVALFYIQFYLARPIGRGPAGPSVASESFGRVWTTEDVLLVGVGDSVTAGLGADTKSHSYFERLRENPEDEFPEMQDLCLSKVMPNLRHMNIAVSGSTSFQHLAWVEERLEVQSPDTIGLVVITTGGNDLIHSYGRSPPRKNAMYGATLEQAEPWIDGFASRLTDMVDLIDERFPGGCQIYLADIYDPTDGVGDAPSVFLPDWPDGLAIHGRYNDVIRQVCQDRDNVHHVPMHETFLGHGSHCCQFWREHYDSSDPHYWFYMNVEDPNDRGYDAIRRCFLNVIADTWGQALANKSADREDETVNSDMLSAE